MYRSIIYIIKPALSIFIFGIFISVCYVIFPKSFVIADSSLTQLQQQAQSLQNLISQDNTKISQNNGAISSLSSSIQMYKSLIYQKQLLINNEQSQIDQLNSQISSIVTQIQIENNKINIVKEEIDKNALSDYEQSYVPPVTLFMGNANINSSLTSVAYFGSSIKEENSLEDQLHSIMLSLNQNETQLNLSKQNVVSLQNQYASQQQSLIANQNTLQEEESQYVNDNNSLNSLNSSYSNQLQNVLSQISALELQSGTPGILPQNVPCQEGPYYSQECPSWGSADLAGTGYTYENAGCSLIAAIIAENIIGNTGYNPYSVNSSEYWDYNGTIFNNFPGIQDATWGNSASINLIDAYASMSNPVVVGFYVPDNPFGTHFVVLTGPLGSSGNMQDPWFGPNLTFGQNMGGFNYESGNIFVAIAF